MCQEVKCLFIFNGATKNNGVVGVSGGDVRLFEIIKNSILEEKYILTTPNGEELLKKFDVYLNKIFKINYSVGSGIFSNFSIAFKSFFCLPKEVRDYKGVVYSSCEHLYDVLPAFRMKILNGCKWYAVYHWVENFPWKEKRGGTPFIIRYLYWANRVFSGFIIKFFADKILAVSDQTKEKLIKIKGINPKKIKAVYAGVEYAKIANIGEKYLSEKGNKYDAVFMKRLNYGKGVFDLLEIWREVCKQKPTASLAIIGDGPQGVVDALKEFIEKNNLKENISLLGPVYDFEEKFRLLNSAKLFVLPSREENWAIVIGEAMAIKLPVLVYALTEIVPIWKDNVEWVEVGNTHLFAEKIVSYLDSDKKREAIASRAFDFVKQYDWQKIAIEEFN